MYYQDLEKRRGFKQKEVTICKALRGKISRNLVSMKWISIVMCYIYIIAVGYMLLTGIKVPFYYGLLGAIAVWLVLYLGFSWNVRKIKEFNREKGFFLEKIPVGVITADKDLNLVYWNNVFLQEYSFKEEELRDKNFRDVFPSIFKRHQDKIVREVIKNKNNIKLTNLVYRSKRIGRVTLDVSFYPLIDRGGNIQEISLIIENRTQLDKLRQEVKDTEGLLQETYLESVRALVEVLEAKDLYTKGHSDRVREYALLIGKEMHLGKDEMGILERACMLHDIGKVGISDMVLNKKKRFSSSDFLTIMRHPEIAEEILEPVKVLHLEQPVIRHHHERYDGKGYPDGKKGDEAPLGSRIIAVADSLDAILSDRPYRKAISIESAIDEIKRGSGTQFDPKVVEAFLKVIEKEGLEPFLNIYGGK